MLEATGSPAPCQGAAVCKASCKHHIAVFFQQAFPDEAKCLFYIYFCFSCFEEKSASLAPQESGVSAWNERCMKNKNIFNFKEHF